MEQLENGAHGSRLGFWGRAGLWLAVGQRSAEGLEMMSGIVCERPAPAAPAPRHYDVIARSGGWSIVLNGACTRPFRSRRAAERIARTLQKQADALHGLKSNRAAH